MKYTNEELQLLGIKKTKGSARGRSDANAYIYKCPTCGREVVKFTVIISRPVYCNLCRTNAHAKRKVAKAIEQQDAKRLESMLGIDYIAEDRFYKAAKAVSKHGNYKDGIAKAERSASKYGSVPEAVTAIILSQRGIEYIAQAKVGKNTVDFLVTDKRVAIEVDGAIFHADENKQSLRDSELAEILGSKWTIMHLPAESIVKSPKTFDNAIRKRLAQI